MLRAEGLVCYHKRTYRLYREEKLQVRRKQRKTLHRLHVRMSVPTARTQRWPMEFVSDQLANGGRILVLNVVDEHTRECLGQRFDISISGGYVARFLDQLIDRDGRQKTIVCHNGPEFTGKEMFYWTERSGVRLHFLQPGKPKQNAFVESFNGEFRAQCLNLHWLASLEDSRHHIEQ